MKQLPLLLLSLFFSAPVWANVPGLSAIYGRDLLRAQASLAASGLIGVHGSGCRPSVARASADGKLSMTLAFGYMDVSDNPDFYDSASSVYRVGDVLDADARAALEQILTAPCPSRRMVACGFSGRNGRLQKNIRDRFSGRSVSFTVDLVSSSVSPRDSANRSSLATSQARQTQTARSRFLSAVAHGDAAVYLGHARSGGGPDFGPPHLLGNGRVDFAAHRSSREGLRSLLGALRGAERPPAVLALLACRSAPLFAGTLRPHLGDGTLVAANELFDYNDILPTALGVVEAVGGQACGRDFENIVAWRSGRGMISVR